MKNCAAKAENTKDFYTVIIPVRNEKNNVTGLFHDLQRQEFSSDRFEIIFVNDHSEDSTVPCIEQLLNTGPVPTRVVDLVNGEGKKAALQLGIALAKGSIIVTTDGDCRVLPGWLKSISGFYKDSNIEMVFGPVTFEKENTLVEKLQTIEFASLIGTGAASLTLGMPNMCNGANLSFRKEAFAAVDGYAGNEDIASGDDEFLMHKIYRSAPKGVRFNRSVEGVVYTKAHERLTDFFHQRKRWASKWRLYANPGAIVLAIFIFLLNLSIIMTIGLLIVRFSMHQWLLIPLLMKILLEGFFLWLVLRFLRKKLNPFPFIILQFTYPFYVILFGIAVNFGKFTWKGRKH